MILGFELVEEINKFLMKNYKKKKPLDAKAKERQEKEKELFEKLKKSGIA